MNTWNSFMLQDPSSPIAENMIMFHDLAMMMIAMITVAISYIFMNIMTNKFTNRFLLENQTIEIIWTIIPMIILLLLAVPSLKVLYLSDDFDKVSMTIKCIGHQWYWKYEYSDFNNKIEFDSFMITNLEMNSFRLLDVDNRMIFPQMTPIRLIITSMDVIHSWAMPSMGIKIDAVPGRLNQGLLMSKRPGLYFGQCSEICGTNHSFMPIVIESTSFKIFMNWINNN